MKVVLDTNVIISALIAPNSTPGRILSSWLLHSFDTGDADLLALRGRYAIETPADFLNRL